MDTNKKEVWGIIPARGGSKSIPYKNIAPLKNRPLIDYVYCAAKSSCIEKVFCSTNDEKISRHCQSLNLKVHQRPENLSGDETPIIDVLIYILEDFKRKIGYIPFAIALFQPTSPFVLPDQVNRCVETLLTDEKANSVQTITSIPHNFHALNQRVIRGGYVDFVFPGEREIYYNKQKKPKHYIFGNLVITKSEAILKEQNVFAPPCVPIEIPFTNSLDVDGPEDFDLADFYISSGKVVLLHLKD